MMTLIAWMRFMSPEETKPTAITVMIEEDCTIIVEMRPVPTAAVAHPPIP